MTADLAMIPTDSGTLDAMTRQGVVALLTRGKEWLDLAVTRDAEVSEIANYKAEAATLRAFTVQKQLGKDAVLAASELVRRAERGLGVAVRKGQKAGTIRDRSYGGPRSPYLRDGKVVQVDRGANDTAISPSQFLPEAKERVDIYAVTDLVDVEQFEAGLAEAKAEGNLSRANVVRKVRQKSVREVALEPVRFSRPEVLRKTHRLNSERIVEQTVASAVNVVVPSLMDQVTYGSLDRSKLAEWISSLSESIKALQRLRTTLERELNHG